MVVLAGIVVLVLAIIAAAWTSSLQKSCLMDPIAVDLGPLPEEKGFWAPEFNMGKLEKIYVGHGPEDVAVDSQGVVYTGLEDGWLKTIGVDGTVENHTFVGSQMLGVAVGPGDEIYCAVPNKGLFKISKDGVLHLLASEVDGTEIKFADAVAVAKDGAVYFSDASTKFRVEDNVLDIVEGRLNGRVLKYDPSTASTSVVVNDLGFANGVALSENEDFLLICETSRARVVRLWLKGEKEGTLETFIDSLPGIPDNVHLSKPDGNFYIGLPRRRTKSTDWVLATPSLLLRCLVVHPIVLSVMGTQSGGRMIVVSPEGELVKKYEDPTGKVMTEVMGGKIIGDYVYFSTLAHDFVGRLKLQT